MYLLKKVWHDVQDKLPEIVQDISVVSTGTPEIRYADNPAISDVVTFLTVTGNMYKGWFLKDDSHRDGVFIDTYRCQHEVAMWTCGAIIMENFEEINASI